jgi:hypothetical protein
VDARRRLGPRSRLAADAHGLDLFPDPLPSGWQLKIQKREARRASRAAFDASQAQAQERVRAKQQARSQQIAIKAGMDQAEQALAIYNTAFVANQRVVIALYADRVERRGIRSHDVSAS